MASVAVVGLAVGALALVGCGKRPIAQADGAVFLEPAAELEQIEPAPIESEHRQPLVLDEVEEQLLSGLVDDIRNGVRPFSEDSIGICRGTRACDQFLGTDVGELPPGNYIVMAELQVPNVGERGTWSVVFQTVCTTGGVETTNVQREYEVVYSGREGGYRLSPLRMFSSPSAEGALDCTYTITAPHPNGGTLSTGSWSVAEQSE